MRTGPTARRGYGSEDKARLQTMISRQPHRLAGRLRGDTTGVFPLFICLVMEGADTRGPKIGEAVVNGASSTIQSENGRAFARP